MPDEASIEPIEIIALVSMAAWRLAAPCCFFMPAAFMRPFFIAPPIFRQVLTLPIQRFPDSHNRGKPSCESNTDLRGNTQKSISFRKFLDK